MKKLVLRIVSALTAVLLLSVLTLVPAFAWGSEGDISSIDVTVTLLEDGTAQVVEQWDVELDDDWSELYVPKNYLGDMSIKNLAVKDLTEGVEYTYTGENWDIGEGRSTEEKRAMKYHRCGMLTTDEDGFELCWGVDGEGEHKYQLSYLMANAVQHYTDGYDGFHIRFVNEDLSSTPDHVSVTIDTAETEPMTHDNTKFWAFGLMGTTRLEDGRILVESEENGDINFCSVMVRFDEGLFSPSVNNSQSFDNLVERAFEGSDYDLDAYENGTSGGDADTSLSTTEEQSFFSRLLSGAESVGSFLIQCMVWVFLAAFAIYALTQRGSRGSGTSRITSNITKQEKKDANWSRDLPFGGNLTESYLALDTLSELPAKGAIIEAYLLKWMKNGWARVEQTTEKRLGGLLSDKEVPSIVFVPEQKDKAQAELTGAEKDLWNLLHRAAGGDEILQEKELKKYSESHYEALEDFFEDALNEGMNRAKQTGHVTDTTEKKLFFTSHQTVLSPSGKEAFLQLLGFKKFLQDFTIINEREARDVGLWGDYLTFAALFGIADEVAKQFEKLVPDFFTNPAAYGYYGSGWDTYDMLYMMHVMNRFSNTAYNSYMAGRSASEINTASSGGGGFSSFGGGGGFSGGGVGGGGR